MVLRATYYMVIFKDEMRQKNPMPWSQHKTLKAAKREAKGRESKTVIVKETVRRKVMGTV